GVRHKDEHRGAGLTIEGAAHLGRDVDQLRLALGREPELPHRPILRAVATEAPSTRELDAFRDAADAFLAELEGERYEHYAGHKPTLELDAVYERHSELTQLETAHRLEGAPVELWRFACEGFLGSLTRRHEERLAAIELELEAVVDGETIPFRML